MAQAFGPVIARFLPQINMDQIFTNRIGAFLQLKNPTDEQIKSAATMLLQCNPSRERGIYNSAMIRPQAMLPWIRTDLKKYYAIRMKGLTLDKVPGYNAAAVKVVRETLSFRPEDVESEKAPQVPVLGVRGRRADHDKLPESVQALWDKNSDRWKTIRQLHNQLLVMVSKPGYQACDGNELCYTLSEADKQLRKDYQKYDTYVVGDGNHDSVDAFTDNVKIIGSARTAISRGLQRKTQTDESRKKIQSAVDTLKSLGQVIKPATVEKIKVIGVNV